MPVLRIKVAPRHFLDNKPLTFNREFLVNLHSVVLVHFSQQLKQQEDYWVTNFKIKLVK
jgi:hypothetical protein